MTDPCTRCANREAVLHTYWGDPLCRPCCAHVAALLDAHDKWPPVPNEYFAEIGVPPDAQTDDSRSSP